MPRTDIASIRPASPGDAAALARLYAEALADDVAARLGHDYLARIFFPALLGSDDARIVLAENAGDMLGFCAIATDSAAVNAALKARPLAAARAAAASALRDPRLPYDLYGALFRIKRALAPGMTLTGMPEVYLIGVRPTAQRRGIGRLLLAEGLAGLPGAATGDLACVAKTSSPRAAEFYRRQGFAEVGTEWRGARAFHVMLYRDASASGRQNLSH